MIRSRLERRKGGWDHEDNSCRRDRRGCPCRRRRRRIARGSGRSLRPKPRLLSSSTQSSPSLPGSATTSASSSRTTWAFPLSLKPHAVRRGTSRRVSGSAEAKATNCSFGIGRANRKPWKARQPSWRRSISCRSVSTPSATTDSFRFCAKSRMVWTIARSLALVSRSRMNERSILSGRAEAAEIGERRIAGAEVVERELDAHRLQHRHRPPHFDHVVEHHVLGQFEREQGRVGAGLAEGVGDGRDEFGPV